MKFHELGDKKNPSIMMIHGGENAWWNYLRQARTLSERFHVILPTLDGHGEEYETEYVSTEDTADKPRIKRQTLYNMYRTYMMQYTLKESVRETKAKVMYWYGEKEMACVKKSAKMFQFYVPSCEIYEAKNCNHRYLALYLPEQWLKAAEPFLEAETN